MLDLLDLRFPLEAIWTENRSRPTLRPP